MFTGLIEKIGKVKNVNRNAGMMQVCIELPEKESIGWEVKNGDSISVDGVCLTVVKSQKNLFWVDVSRETQHRSTLKFIKPGDRVNLERALRAGQPMGGHFVYGHVDGLGRIKHFSLQGADRILSIQTDRKLLNFLVEKGSIACDGISLTIAELRNDSFSVVIVPYTFEHTTLQWKKPGDFVNLEVDIIGKYVAQFLHKDEQITEEYLKAKGFL